MNTNPIRRRFFKTLSLFLTALVMAFVVWIAAINATDPLEIRIYPNPVPLEVIGLDPNLVISNSSPQNIDLILTAPQSTWATLINGYQPVKATVDLTGLSIGQYDLEIKIQIDLRAIRIENIAPRSIHVNLEPKLN
jgi:YbbR domain-containing protein